RRAADARGLARADAAPAPAPARRAVLRPRAARRARALRHPAHHQREGEGQHAARRAERGDRPRARRPGLPHRNRPRGPLGPGGPDPRRRSRATQLPRILMEAFLHQVLAGLATGGIYASLALALVMIYQATHLVN